MKGAMRNAALFAALAAMGFAASAQEAAIHQIQGNVAAVAPHSRDARPTTVVVLLSGDSVAAVQKNAGRLLNDSERSAIIAARSAESAAAVFRIRQLGGRVLNTFHSALNGVKVSIAADRLRALRSLPGFVDIKKVGEYERLNATSVPLIGAPQVWQAPAHYQGQNMKIAIIDTGIDYTHANFGGPGTVAAYNAAKATDTLPANPAWFGPAAPKVKGGIDLVGDAYTGSNTPVPDPNPLDCEFTSGSVGHGSHVAGTAAGFGVKADGTTFAGPYNAAAYTPGAFLIGPGVAPQANLYAVRVFGCSGNTNVVTDAIDWAVANGMDVISMSLGSNYGVGGDGIGGNSAERTAVANAAAAGIIVVAASGNAGQVPYITSAPAVFDGAISVAATDALASLPTANLALSSGANIGVQNSNGAIFADGLSMPIVVLRNTDGTVSLGCDPNEYDPAHGGANVVGKLVVTMRGNCARVFRAGAAHHFGAAGAAMINTSAGFPPYEGPIPGGAPTPTDGNIYEPVPQSFPFFGVLQSDTTTLTGPTGGPAPANAVATNTPNIANPGFKKIASFSSAGPRIGDSVLRPGVTAPGVSTVSTASGTGNGFQILSGTSMATPHVAGVAALVKQANPSWSVADLRAAVVQTASPSTLFDYTPRNEGAGLVQAVGATGTQAVVRMPSESVSFGFADLLTDFNATKMVTVHNAGPKAVQFNIGVVKSVGPGTLTAPPSVIVGGNSDATFPVSLNVPAASVGGGTGFQDIGGYLRLTPSSSRLNNNVSLSVPWYLVAHSRSNLAASRTGTTLNFTNAGGAIAATPGFYTLGLYQPTPQGAVQNDVRAVGARVSGSNVFFGVNTHNRTSTTLAFQEFDVCIDTSGGPVFTPNKVLIGINGSAFGVASIANKFTTALFPADANCNVTGSGTLLFTVTQPTDNSTVQIPVPWGGSGTSGLGLTAGNPRFKYALVYWDTDGNGFVMPGVGSFNPITPAVTFGAAPTVAPNATGSSTVNVTSEIASSPALGAMVLAPDNVSGSSQALLISLPSPP